MRANKTVDTHRFAMTPRADIPRSTFRLEHTHKTTFDAGQLIPIYVEEVLPGDTFQLNMTAFGRLSTPLFPIMDNLHLNTFFFFVPYRLVWDNWQKFMGEQLKPGDSIDYITPSTETPAGGYPANTLGDYFGLPTVGAIPAQNKVAHSALPFRAYNLIWNEWFRDENLQDPVTVRTNDGPDNDFTYYILTRGKRHDYFTSALPWPQKGASVTLPLGTTAPVISTGDGAPIFTIPGNTASGLAATVGSNNVQWTAGASSGTEQATWNQTKLVADLSTATAATINQIRTSFQIQKLLERDARGGTRYTEILKAHFGVTSPDARLQRPEYLGGGYSPLNISPVAQTSGTAASETGYTDTPLGNLAATGTLVARGHGFRQSFTEHGVIIGLACVTADLTYQQGIRRMWFRRTRYDHYFPAFAHLGEQAIQNREIYVQGDAQDLATFGYQERWAEYRYTPSMITGLFRSTTQGTLDAWHLAQRFTALPTLNAQFIIADVPLDRILAVGEEALGKQILFDAVFTNKATRALPAYSVPGLIDHF